MDVDRRALTAGIASCALSIALSGLARAQTLEKPSIRLGVANKAHLYYLPVTLAERRGHFRDYGLNVAITDFEGGAQSLDALLTGTVDVVTVRAVRISVEFWSNARNLLRPGGRLLMFGTDEELEGLKTPPNMRPMFRELLVPANGSVLLGVERID